MNDRAALKVFITVDTELWPLQANWPRVPLAPDRGALEPEHDIYILGRTPAGDFGLPFILETLGASGLRATFFVESLHALAVGNASLASTVATLGHAGQDVQLHVHTEWLGDIRLAGLPRRFGPALAGYDREEQRAIIAHALSALSAVSKAAPRAFRAGSYGASRETLVALEEVGIAFDSSHNRAFGELTCRFAATDPLVQPARFGSVREYPVSCFEDYADHFRHAQVGAISVAEMRWLLKAAWSAGWAAVVIVLHSSEFVHKGRLPVAARSAKPNWRLIHRYRKLCEFLASNRGWFEVATFGELPSDDRLETTGNPAELRSAVWRTIGRTAAQTFNRIESRWA